MFQNDVTMVNERKDYISITVLFIVNLLNFVDRYTVAGKNQLFLIV